MFGVVLTELSLVVLSLNVKARPPRRISCPQLELQSIDCQAAIADCRAAILGLRLPGCDCRAAIAGPSWSREFPAHIGQENFLPTLVKGISCPHWSREHWSREFPAHTGQGNFLPTLVRRFPAHTGQGNFLPTLVKGISCPHPPLMDRENQHTSRTCWTSLVIALLYSLPFCQRPYCVEYTRSHPNSEVNRQKARSVLGWGIAWEALRVPLAFSFPFVKLP